jgi:hypothetical protein
MVTLPSLQEGWRMYGEESIRAPRWPSKPFAPIHLGTERRQRRCALNVPETPLSKPTLQILWSMVLVWKRLSHPGIAAFLGVDTEVFPLALVYDWGENILQYMESHPEASRPALVLDFLSCDATNITSLWAIAAGSREGFRVPPLARYSAWEFERSEPSSLATD